MQKSIQKSELNDNISPRCLLSSTKLYPVIGYSGTKKTDAILLLLWCFQSQLKDCSSSCTVFNCAKEFPFLESQ